MARGHKRHTITCLSELAGVLACKHGYPIKQVKGIRRKGRIRFDGLEIKSPKILQGIRATSLTGLVSEMREQDRLNSAGYRTSKRVTGEKFHTLDEGVAAFRALNPQLDELLGALSSRMDEAYLRWVRRGRRGPKPTPEEELGQPSSHFKSRFDWVIPYADKPSRQKVLTETAVRATRARLAVTSWIEALYTIMPRSKLWADLAERLPDLEEALRQERLIDADGSEIVIQPLEVPGDANRIEREHYEHAIEDFKTMPLPELVDKFREKDQANRGWTQIRSPRRTVTERWTKTAEAYEAPRLPAYETTTYEAPAYEAPAYETPAAEPPVSRLELDQAEREAEMAYEEDRREREAIQTESKESEVPPDDSDLPF